MQLILMKGLADGDLYSSPIMKGNESCDKCVWGTTPCQDLLERFTTQGRYDKLRGNQRFITIIGQLKEKTK